MSHTCQGKHPHALCRLWSLQPPKRTKGSVHRHWTAPSKAQEQQGSSSQEGKERKHEVAVATGEKMGCSGEHSFEHDQERLSQGILGVDDLLLLVSVRRAHRCHHVWLNLSKKKLQGQSTNCACMMEKPKQSWCRIPLASHIIHRKIV